MKAWLVHGFNVSDGGTDTIDMLTLPLARRGWEVKPKRLDYGWRLLTQLWGNPRVAAELAGLAKADDLAIGHSNGCTIIHRATHMDYCKLRNVCYINPALDVGATPGPCVEKVLVLHTSDDVATLLARFLPGVLWGAMGRYGYQGEEVP
jgi:hypothetical protein